MKIKAGYEPEWSLSVRNFQQDETGRQFHHFLTTWLDTAEKLLDEDSALTPYDAVNRALPITENLLGFMHGDYLGQMLLYIVGVWEHGAQAAEGMTPIETKVLATAAHDRTEALQAAAAGQ